MQGNLPYPWIPKPWKMKVLHPKIWVITPKNEGFEFPWYIHTLILWAWYAWSIPYLFLHCWNSTLWYVYVDICLAHLLVFIAHMGFERFEFEIFTLQNLTDTSHLAGGLIPPKGNWASNPSVSGAAMLVSGRVLETNPCFHTNVHHAAFCCATLRFPLSFCQATQRISEEVGGSCDEKNAGSEVEWCSYEIK